VKPEYIIIHHSLTKDTETVSWGAIRKYHTQTLGWREIGYHYGIENVNGYYEILVGRQADATGAHCSQEGMNHKSLGVCLIGNFDNAAPSADQLARLTALVKSLMYIHNIPVSKIMRHSQLATYKTCPGLKFPWQDFIAGLQ